MMTVKRNRDAFTLLELLVVIAIIGTLAALTAGAVFRLRTASLETRTNETLSKLQMAYEQQYKSAIDRIRKEQPPAGLIAAANNDIDLAKAVHLKLSLRREFPQNLADVNDMSVAGDATLNSLMKSLYPPKASFVALVPILSGNSRDQQNAVLLYAALSQARGGSSFNPEQVGTNAVGTLTLNGSPQKVFIDGYGKPIYFVRALSTFPAGNTYFPTLLAELNQPPYVTVAAASAKKADALDPAGKLSFAWAGTLATFVQNMKLYMEEPLDGTNRGPFVFSGGTDGLPFTPDDLYSFRLSGTGKAN